MTLRGTTKNAKSAKTRGATSPVPPSLTVPSASSPLHDAIRNVGLSNYATLGDLELAGLVTLGRGKVISKLEIRDVPGDYPVYSSSATGNGEIGRYGKFMFDDERITWSIDGGGRLFYRPAHKYSVTNVCGWLKVNSDEICTRYLHLMLLTKWQRIKFDYTHKAHPSVIREEYKDLTFPPLPTQQRIADELDQLCALKKNAEDRLAILGQIVKSRFVEMFGDPVLNDEDMPLAFLDDLGENLDGRRIPITSSDRIEGPYPYYGASGIVDHVEGFIFDEDLLLVSEDGANLLLRSTPIAFSVRGKIWVNNHAHVIRFSEFATQVFVEYFLNAIKIDKYVTGSAQPKLNQAKLNSIPIINPPLSLQREFAAFVAEVDKSKLTLRETVATLDQLYRAKLQEYFG